MAILNLEYYTQKDLYSDGDIEKQMLCMAKNGISFEDLPKEQVDFPIIYHFSDLRTNILCWYPFSKKDSVLEIGAGCGAITGMLCEKAGYVTSVELSKRRSEINFERNKNHDNLTIMVGNLNDMRFDEPFDYVVVNGVLEYAMSFTEGDTPYETFLQKMGSYLKDSGKLLIAIENKLGFKYFAGAPEDHTDLYFFGIEGYPDNKSVRTFSKTELSELLEKSGFPYMKYYYPYPDYKFPTEIFTDETLYKNMYGKEYPVYTENNFAFFSETAGIKSLVKERILDKFVNSFLVIAGKKELCEEKKILYVKLNQNRKKEFRIQTQIIEENDKKVAVKSAMNPHAVPFVKGLEDKGKQEVSAKCENLRSIYQNDEMFYEFLEGETLHQKIKAWADEGDIQSIVSALEKFYEAYFVNRKKETNYQTEEFCQIFGSCPGKDYYECIKPANVDMICANIFVEEENYKIIDYEWVFPFAVPVSFIIWRMIHDVYTQIPAMVSLCPEEKMMEKFGIEYSDYEIFMQWALHFVYKYVGSDPLDAYRKPRLSPNFGDIAADELIKSRMKTILYYDLGYGLNEKDVIESIVTFDRDRFSVTYDLTGIQGIQGVRWNFVKGHFSEVKIDNIDYENRIELLPGGMRIEKDDRTTIFFTTDAFYYVNAWDWKNPGKLTIEGRIRFLNEQDIEEIMVEEQEKRKSLDEKKTHKSVPVVDHEVQEKRPIGKKEKIKAVLKRVLGRGEADVNESAELPEVITNCVGSVDYNNYENYILNLVGWVFDMDYPMEHPHIAFCRGNEKVFEDSYSVIFRKDVAQVLQIPDAETSGFSYVGVVRAPENLDVCLEYNTEAGTRRYYLTTIPADEDVEEILIYSLEKPGSLGNIQYFNRKNLQSEKIPYPPMVGQQIIDVIVPIYNGLEYFDALFGSIERTRMSYRLILVDDHSPDERVKDYLEQYAAGRENVVLMRNEVNVGFVRSVNRALEFAEHHVALVNTDVEVPDEWLERLMFPILMDSKVATTTPFTTCGTICSFPDFCKDNQIFEGMALWQVDEAFRKIRPLYPSMPTGVGFCMGMNIQAVREIGVLDADTFGKGYGEENDWCQRAIEAGYRNVHVDNLFVYHKHGGSFPSEEKMKLLEHNRKELVKKHPDYDRDTASYCRKDPLRTVRLYVQMHLLNQKLDVPTIVAFDHILGGGATEYLKEKKKSALTDGYRFITITFDFYTGRYYLNYEYRQYNFEFYDNKLEGLFDNILRIDEIWINELVTYQYLYQTLDDIVKLKRKHQAFLKMLLHDFFCMCPAINLLDENGIYCKGACEDKCNKCIPLNKSNACLEFESGTIWRQKWCGFLQQCDEIRAFSDDTARLFRKVYPEVCHVRVIPHTPHYLLPLHKYAKSTETFNIGLLGVLSYKKGLDIVRSMISYIEENHMNIRIKLLGVVDEEIDSPIFSYTGRYTREQLPKLTLQEDIDMFFIPSIWPETFSYTTSEIISMNMPLAVFDLGAPADRVKRYEKGVIITDTDAETIVSEMLSFAKNVLKCDSIPVQKKRILFVGEEISFASRYRVEHFREQLSHYGYRSDFIQVEDKNQIKTMEQYDTLVLYRCAKTAEIKELITMARNAGIPVYYDIDDLIFDYGKISFLHFLKGSEYVDFENTTENIHECMSYCDGYITSTETLAREIEEAFPGKPVVVNRNCASMEMQILSHDAVEQVKKDEDKIYIGYFSGSKTHDQDFKLVEEALLEIMEEFPQVYLKLVGVLSENVMKRMEKRIEKLPFMEWQKLPEVIAGIDINLMPLENSIFHCCKSENKWMEAALVKVPSVMSRNIEMEHVIDNGKTAWLCSTKNEWLQALKELVANPDERKRMGENAYHVVMERYITQNTGKDVREKLL